MGLFDLFRKKKQEPAQVAKQPSEELSVKAEMPIARQNLKSKQLHIPDITPPKTLGPGVLKYTYTDVNVVGSQYLEEKTPFACVQGGDNVTLEWERDNAYDNTAVVVKDSQDRIIGYLPKGKLKDMAHDWVRRSEPIFSKVSSVNRLESKIQLTVAFYSTKPDDINDSFLPDDEKRYRELCKSDADRKEFTLTGNKNGDMQENLACCGLHDEVSIEEDFESGKFIVDSVGLELGVLSKSSSTFFSENIEFSDPEAFISYLEDGEDGKYKCKVTVFYNI